MIKPSDIEVYENPHNKEEVIALLRLGAVVKKSTKPVEGVDMVADAKAYAVQMVWDKLYGGIHHHLREMGWKVLYSDCGPETTKAFREEFLKLERVLRPEIPRSLYTTHPEADKAPPAPDPSQDTHNPS